MLPNVEIDPLAADAPDQKSAHEPASTALAHGSYKERLKRWAIARIEEANVQTIVARFRSHSDAEGHLKFLRQQFPAENFTILFEK